MSLSVLPKHKKIFSTNSVVTIILNCKKMYSYCIGLVLLDTQIARIVNHQYSLLIHLLMKTCLAHMWHAAENK